MFKGIMVVVIGVILYAGSPLLASAQEETEVDFISGNVASVSTQSLTIKAFNAEGDEEEVVLAVSDKTELENMNSIDELSVGDYVYVDYTEVGGEKNAVNIFKSNENYDDEDLGESNEELSQELGDGQENQE
jgi:hypothetical protein